MIARARGRALATVWRSTGPSWTLVLLAFALLLWTYQVGMALGMADSVSKVSIARARISMAVAISHLAYGATGYLLYEPVRADLVAGGFDVSPTAGAMDINGGIANALGKAYQVHCGSESTGSCWDDWGDDKGYADYVTVAFALFGFNVQALYHLYFLVLALSLAAFCLQFFRAPVYLALAPLVLAAHYLVVLILRDSPITYVVHDSRFLPALAYLAAIHLAALLLRRTPSSPWDVPLVAIQLLVVVFVIDGRSSAMYLIPFILGSGLCGIALNARGRLGLQRFVRNRAWIFAVVMAAPFILTAYRQLAYDSRYFNQGRPSHVVWHAMYMGLSVHPESAANAVFYSDMTACDAGYRALLREPNEAAHLVIKRPMSDFDAAALDIFVDCQWVAKYVGWGAYDEFARIAYFDFVVNHARYVLESYLFYKPLAVADQMLWQLGRTEQLPAWWDIDPIYRPSQRDVLDLIGFPTLAVVIPAVLVVYPYGTRTGARDWILLAGGLFLASLAPSILVAPIYYEMPIVFLTFSLAAYAVGGAAVLLTMGHPRLSPDWLRREEVGRA